MSPIMPDLLGVGTAQPRLNLTGASTPTQAQPLANAWKVGEILQAHVLGATGAGMTRLDINGLEVSTKAPLPLAEGDRLELQVTQPGPPPQLRILQHQPAQTNALEQALRQALPRGAGSEVLPRLMNLLQEAGESTEWSPSQRQAIQQLREALPTLTRLTDPVRLEQQVRASGLFLEHDLAQGAPQPGDLKAALLRVLASLPQPSSPPAAPATPPSAQPAATQGTPQTVVMEGAPEPAPTPAPPGPVAGRPAAAERGHTEPAAAPARGEAPLAARDAPARVSPEPPTAPAPQGSATSPLADTLRGAIEGALARVHLNQISSLQTQGTEQAQWVMEFPLPKGHGETPLKLRLEREGQRAGGGSRDSGWRLDLDFSLEPLGPLRASVVLRGEQLNVRLWAERPATLARLQNHLDLLDAGLRRTGLEVAHLACYPGQPVITGAADEPRPAGGLLDISA
ncbi:flagellar hook-length control protein FliK [Thiofaba sp. EF100]|uniref:flagellar hook-length control protein FliK n=1 Tax=Thiofaba sp. EF100 TaxID=3121274 RepID=UPI0032217AEF